MQNHELQSKIFLTVQYFQKHYKNLKMGKIFVIFKKNFHWVSVVRDVAQRK